MGVAVTPGSSDGEGEGVGAWSTCPKGWEGQGFCSNEREEW